MAKRQKKSTDILHVIVAQDQDANEAIYVDGELHPIVGNTAYARDIDAAVKGKGSINFKLVKLELSESFTGDWPQRFEELLQYVGDR